MRSFGRLDRGGRLILDQRIERAGHAPQQRQWHIRRAGGGYAATLTSADGPVRIAVSGNLLRLDFREHGLAVHQDLLLAMDGRSAVNHMTLSKLGVTVATLDERIEKAAD